MSGEEQIAILFVCHGNICRSPLAEALFRFHVEAAGLEEHFRIGSCGTGKQHSGKEPDRAILRVARRHGMSIKVHRGRQLREDDAKEAHMIIGMDGTNVRAVRHQCRLGVGSTPDRLSGQHTHERTTAGIHVLRQWDPRGGGGVPDPFGRGSAAYEEVFTIVNRSCISLLRFLRRRNDLF